MTLLSSAYAPAVFIAVLIAWWQWQLYCDPLKRVRGPFWAKITHLWKAYHTYRRDLPDVVLEAHRRYGPVIRIGPNDVNFQSHEAINAIFKAGISMPKTAFYDAFTAITPNLFSARDESFHAMRRRQMANSFSLTTILKFESTFNKHVDRLFHNVEHTAGTVFDIKDFTSCYAFDVLGELAFSKDLNTQRNPSRDQLPPIPDHILLGTLFGSVRSLLPYSIMVIKKLPIPGLQKLLASRQKISSQAAGYVKTAIEKHTPGERDSLLANILEAEDPETGARLTTDEICAESFAFLVVGAHTTAATLGLLFYHLMHNPSVGKKLTEELDANVPIYGDGGDAVQYAGIEGKLPYAMACIKENYRMTAVFNMPLPREVTDPAGIDICGKHMPYGLLGPDHDNFIPERWLDGRFSMNDIIPFGVGHRACIGRNIAGINILKTLYTLWRNFDFKAVDEHDQLEMDSVGVGEKKCLLLCTARKRLTSEYPKLQVIHQVGHVPLLE